MTRVGAGVCRRGPLWALVALAAAAAPCARGAEVVLVTQRAVPQYAQLADAFLHARPGAVAVDVADGPAALDGAARADVVVAAGSRALDEVSRRLPAGAVVGAGMLASEVQGKRLAALVPLEPRASDALASLAELAPAVRRVVVLHPGSGPALEDAQAAARKTDLAVEFQPLESLDNLQDRFRAAARGRDAVWVLSDARLARPEIVKFMISTCLELRMPLVGFLDGMTRSGALLSVSADFAAIGREAAQLAGELAARPGERAKTLLRFTHGHVTVNDRTREVLRVAGAAPKDAEVIR